MNEERLLLTGGSGFLGSRLALLAAAAGGRIWATHLHNPVPESPGVTPIRLDLTSHVELTRLLEAVAPTVVIHTAYSMSDAVVNIESTSKLVAACVELPVQPFFLFTSTDLIFDGSRGDYTEGDDPRPAIEYGRQKLAAEKIVHRAIPQAAIVRPSLIYDLHRLPRHLGFAVEAIGRGEPFTFFDDEYRCPVLADELAGVILELCKRRQGGTWHTAGADRVDRWWFGVRLLAALGYPIDLARRGRSADLPGERPADCSLNGGKLRSTINMQLSGAKKALAHIKVES
ncbi:SDR family oxidoreductase [Gemmatimonadota bacterium]